MALPQRDLELRSALKSLPSLLVCCVHREKGEKAILAGLALSVLIECFVAAGFSSGFKGPCKAPAFSLSSSPGQAEEFLVSLPPPAAPNNPSDHKKQNKTFRGVPGAAVLLELL